MDNSILTHPERGPWGNSRYRGNCSGHIIRKLLQYFKPTLFVDPAEGGGTSRDVAREFPKLQYYGFDLKDGFNLLRDRLIERLPREADLAFFHPPYGDIIQYSGNVWGLPHPDDLSRCLTREEFMEKLQVALQNIYESVRPGGNYTVLIGDVRKDGDYWSIQSDVIQVAPGKLEGVLIKGQFNCVSDSLQYRGKFIPIRHEYLINMKKERQVLAFLDCAVQSSTHMSSLSSGTWKAITRWTLQKLGGQATLTEIYKEIGSGAREKTLKNPNWQAKVRQTLQQHFTNVSRGTWQLPETTQAA